MDQVKMDLLSQKAELCNIHGGKMIYHLYILIHLVVALLLFLLYSFLLHKEYNLLTYLNSYLFLYIF